ncbi:MAG: type II toxin-antitoxin system RelE/ParE family toxin [Calditrichaeota bacterium]|nr:type II toxin-antitoxin system RelE/ParE family toxin [Calditrichota bacterium]MCB9090688.1 type II toxin-antitoxin system RelE/ParE family toxin [Calditrichia bacterium]MCB0289210.1 type II toxin-antitoxin system RelE/ParE family toxin [Calditrichota bacterium]MCB0297759.1 type II toxin-antitoxin system RelE/ParE family toxin [Calditrichota bacterium]MCB0304450.1 type II toxin-antitoxin system RelE/ParE family toxin [Calditrichota bacterium]
MKLLWSELAIERVTAIASHINQINPNDTEKWIEKCFDRVLQLKDFPKSGRIVPELSKTNIREIFYGNYRIIYKLEPTRIIIMTLRHSRQTLRARDMES